MHSCKPIRTLLTQNSNNIGKILLPRSVCNSHAQLFRETWFTQEHVNQLVCAGINTVRIPVRWLVTFVLLSHSLNDTTVQLGYWIVEPLVNRATEFYPRGGMSQLVSFPYHSATRQITDDLLLVATRSESVESGRDCSHFRPPRSSRCSGIQPDVCWKVN